MAVFNPSVPGRSVRENRKALVWSREISVAHFSTIALATRILVDLKRVQVLENFIHGVCRLRCDGAFLSHVKRNNNNFEIMIPKC